MLNENVRRNNDDVPVWELTGLLPVSRSIRGKANTSYSPHSALSAWVSACSAGLTAGCLLSRACKHPEYRLVTLREYGLVTLGEYGLVTFRECGLVTLRECGLVVGNLVACAGIYIPPRAGGYLSTSCRFLWPREGLLRPQEVAEFGLGQIVEFLGVLKQILELLGIRQNHFHESSSCFFVKVQARWNQMPRRTRLEQARAQFVQQCAVAQRSVPDGRCCTTVHTRKSRNVHAFLNLLLDLRDWHVNNLFNCVLLHTFHALFLSSGLFLTDLVVHNRSKIIQERKVNQRHEAQRLPQQ